MGVIWDDGSDNGRLEAEWFARSAAKMRWKPVTEMEQDIYDAFQALKAMNRYSAMFFVADDYARDHEFYIAAPGQNPWAAYHAIRKNEDGSHTMCVVLAALDLKKTFEEQWPYQPGIWSPMALRDKPVNGLPPEKIDPARVTTPAGARRQMPRYIRGVVIGDVDNSSAPNTPAP